jgi:hypothetical protein
MSLASPFVQAQRRERGVNRQQVPGPALFARGLTARPLSLATNFTREDQV